MSVAGAVIAIDVGGTTLKGATFSATGEVLARRSIGTFDVDRAAASGLRTLAGALLEDADAMGASVAGIGIASPGLIDSPAGTVRYAANLGWVDFALSEFLHREFGRPVVLEHDARAAVVAERAVSYPAELDDLLFIPVGTGVSSAIVVGGVTVRGATGGAGEFGHMQVVPSGIRCACGQFGCIEAYASGGAILRRYRDAGGQAESTAQIADRLGHDPLADRIWAEAVDALVTGIVGLTAAIDPAVVVLGGGVSRAGAKLLDPVAQQATTRLGWRSPPRFLLSRLGQHAGLVGTALLGGAGAADPTDFVRRARSGLGGVDPLLLGRTGQR